MEKWAVVLIDDRGNLWGRHFQSKTEVEEYFKSEDYGMERVDYKTFTAMMFSAIEIQKLAFMIVIHYDENLFSLHYSNMNR